MVAQREAQVFANLRAALVENGALIDGVAINENSENDRSLVATRDLAPGHVLLRLPPDLLITERRARQCPTVASIMEQVKKANLSSRLPDVDSADAAITLYLMREMALPNSPLAAWFASLPTRFQTPITADEDDIEEHLSGTPLLRLAEQLRAELREMYDEWVVPYALNAHPDEYPKHICTYEQFIYCHSIYDSRAFHVDDTNLLAPFADMANHRYLDSDQVNVKVRGWKIDDGSGNVDAEMEAGVEMYISSSAAVTAGSELCISYGPFCNGQLLMHFGFAMENNVGDTLRLTLDFPDSDSVQLQMKKQLLLQLDHSSLLSLHHDLTLEKPLPDGLVATTRLLVMDEEEIAPITFRNMNFGVKISDRNESAVVNQLVGLLENMLDDYPVHADPRNKSSDSRTSSLSHYCRIYVQASATIISRAIRALKSL